MSQAEIVDELLKEIAPGLNLVGMLAYEDRDAWLLEFDAHTRVEIEYDPSAARIVIEGAIGEVAEEARPHIYELLLQYNYLWPQTGGIRMALTGESGQAVMLYEMPESSWGPAQLCDVLSNMVNIQRAWREILQVGVSLDAAGPKSPSAPDLTNAHLFLRP